MQSCAMVCVSVLGSKGVRRIPLPQKDHRKLYSEKGTKMTNMHEFQAEQLGAPSVYPTRMYERQIANTAGSKSIRASLQITKEKSSQISLQKSYLFQQKWNANTVY